MVRLFSRIISLRAFATLRAFAAGLSSIAALVLGGSAALSTPLNTLPHGTYDCALPGNASGPAWRVLPGKAIEITFASSYQTREGTGTYLMVGKMVTFTRGPLVGERYEQVGSNTLRRVHEDGSPGKIHCLRGLLIG